MAENVQDIKRRIKSVNSTKQITHAMELVASAKLKKSRGLAEQRYPYFEAMILSMGNIVERTGKSKNALMNQREVKKTAYIIITGDKGLAGGYNGNICKRVESHLKNKDNTVLYTIGSRGRDHFKNRDYKIQAEYLGISENPNFFTAKSITAGIMDAYLKEEFDEVYLVYTRFISTLVQHPYLMKLLPLDAEGLKPKKKIEDVEEKKSLTGMIYEPDPEALLEYLIPNYVANTLYGAMIESAASEQGARRTAMESATENANEMIDDLTLKLNRVRQAAITQEISEIVSGADALS
ncbi:ATP synthase F1 subunit gamma [Acetobacterium paludosum]|uniref:ATP synthase gamma chain n=1 Tax=Acetobacterium paludosum TaxID=52693 RepID=A0A923I3H3_9FIRM|nr:ATP synthase F1 subunit gamma [Acetobacterium paludosum]MBC3889273.1 ATP synthase F1 subunit gamma [Acetobacterium paludosum]